MTDISFMPHSFWDYRLVILSVIVAIVGSYVALDFAHRIKASMGKVRNLWFVSGAFAMGLAIWTMHFVGMLALVMAMPITYNEGLSALSMLAAAIGAGIAFFIVNRSLSGPFQILTGSIAMGLAISSMHYIGMASVQMPAQIEYDPLLFTLSILIAIVASAGALWLAFRLRQDSPRLLFLKKAGSAFIMGIAISGMHYTGMAAAHYLPTHAVISGANFTQSVGGVQLGEILIYAGGFFAIALILLNAQSFAERQRILLALQASEDRNRLLIEGVHDYGIYMLDTKGNITSWNIGAERIFGYQASDIIGKQYACLFIPAAIEEGLPQHIMQKAIQMGKATEEAQRKRKDGSVFWANVLLTALYNESGKLIGFSNISHDITEQKLAERERLIQAKQQEAVANLGLSALSGVELPQLFKTAVNTVATTLDVGFCKIIERLSSRNQLMFCAVVGWPQDLMNTMIEPDFEPHAHYTLKEDKPIVVEDLATEKRFPPSKLHQEYHIKSGVSVIIHGKEVPFGVLEADSKVKRVFTEDDIHFLQAVANILTNAIERKQVEDEKRALNEELEERVIQRTIQLEAVNKELESFSYSVSHDLRSPLRSIDGFSQALLEDCEPQLGEAGKDYLNRIRTNTQRMAQLIEDLLNLSRINRGEIILEEINLSQMVQTIARELQEQAPNREVNFNIEPEVKVKGDKRLLHLALENLLNNAWKFTAKRTTPAQIDFGTLHPNGKPIYFIRDNGAGFDMKYADKLFGAFQRLHTTAEFAGIGIGLATVQRIIHRHGGKIWAEGVIEKGATFYFTLS